MIRYRLVSVNFPFIFEKNFEKIFSYPAIGYLFKFTFAISFIAFGSLTIFF